MATLTGQKKQDSYKDLLQVSNSNSGVDGTLRNIEDGEGTSSALRVSSAAVSVDGNELFLDDDEDTSITADTDDQIDIKVGGSDVYTLTAASLALDGTATLDVNGAAIVLDADGDTTITADTDDQIDFAVGGVLELSLTAAKADNLDDLAGLTPGAGDIIVGDGTDWGAAALTPTDGAFLVADGSTWTAETGATARASLGVSGSEKGSDIASGSNITIPTDGGYFDVTGTTTITDMTVAADRRFTLQFDGALTLTHNASDLILPGGQDITTAAGDVAVFQSEAANTVRLTGYQYAIGKFVGAPQADQFTPAIQIGTGATGLGLMTGELDKLLLIAQGKLIAMAASGGSFHAMTFSTDGAITVNDDTAHTIDRDDDQVAWDGSSMVMIRTSATNTFALIGFRYGASEIFVLEQPSTVVEVASLAGTGAVDPTATGPYTDGAFTIVIQPDTNEIHFVNRRGANPSLSYTFFGGGTGVHTFAAS